MISKLLIVVSVILILLGLAGIVTKNIKRKLIFLTVNTIGMLVLAFSQGKVRLASEPVAGLWQIAYQLPALLCFVLLIRNICKRNDIHMSEDLVGVRQGMPYLFAAGAVFAIVLIGLPGTGTWVGYFLVAFGLMLDQAGIFRYIGLCGILAGIAMNAAITFSILKPAYLPTDNKPKLSLKAGGIYVVFALLLILASVFYDYAAIMISGIESIFS